MLDAAERSFGRDWPAARRVMSDALARRRLALRRLAKARLDGRLDDAGVQRRLERSRIVLAAAFHATAAVTEAAAQRAVDAALQVLERALSRGLGR